MALSVIIAEPSYLLKRGICALLGDIAEAEVVFMNDMQELNSYLDMNVAHAVFINERFLDNQEDAELFFQLKEDIKYIALTDKPVEFRSKQKFDAILNRNAQKEEIVPVIERLLQADTGQTGSKESLLSSREQEVLKQVAMGNTNQKIAEKLFISKHTVISHRKNITSKLGIKTVSGLTVYAVLNDLIPKDQIR